MSKRKQSKKKLNYISLFSGAGIGCYGFQQEGFDCIATVELLEKRIKFQEFNNKCFDEIGYICGDVREERIKNELHKAIEKYFKESKLSEIDVVIATPPCQGMSVANHKKKNEIGRNSLVVESIALTKEYKPRFFLFENVRYFLNTLCTDIDGVDRRIEEAIDLNLGGEYNILKRVVNLKHYGSNSSRTRTIVLGVRKDIKNITPYDLFPKFTKEKTLGDVISDLPSLKEMGEISTDDIFHQFKPYAERMRPWIHNLNQGESAFDYEETYPHRIIKGKKVLNKNKNGDKYKRQEYDKVAPCIHTRNDILASQNTVHPLDDRVFSIRELMRMMTIPEDFKWSQKTLKELNNLSYDEKRAFLKSEEMNIRSSIGEGVPTEVFRRIAQKIQNIETRKSYSKKDLKEIIEKKKLLDPDRLNKFIEKTVDFKIFDLINLVELANANRTKNSAYYTSSEICFSLVNNLPNYKNRKQLRILEPSVGAGAFIPLLIEKYKSKEKVEIDLVDVDKDTIRHLKTILKKLNIPKNIEVNTIHGDYLTLDFDEKYDLIIGNPPFGKVKDKNKLKTYKLALGDSRVNNIFAFFLNKAISMSDTVAYILPKSFLSSPVYGKLREVIQELNVKQITDYGEKAFAGVKIETISLIIGTRGKKTRTKIESYITNEVVKKDQSYIMDPKFPYWLIYRNSFFDEVSTKMTFNIFEVYRDRKITKRHTKSKGKYRVLKSRNIGSNKIVDLAGYDTYVDNIDDFPVSRYLNKPNLILVPNLTYKPRATFLPKKSITDGSVAILIPKEDTAQIRTKDLEYYSTDEFREFYMLARNLGSRSLNIDSNSVFYFGKKYDDGEDQ
jgi:DNA (cytosine-5)-methyltransferase 1